MPGFRGGVFASCVLYLFRLRLPLSYLSIGLFMRRSCHTMPFPLDLPCRSSLFPSPPPLPVVFGACIAHGLYVPFWQYGPW